MYMASFFSSERRVAVYKDRELYGESVAAVFKRMAANVLKERRNERQLVNDGETRQAEKAFLCPSSNHVLVFLPA